MPEQTGRGCRRVEHLMGTVFSFDIRGDLRGDTHGDIRGDTRGDTRGDVRLIGLLDEVVGWLRWVDATFSTYRTDSEISRLGRGALRVEECAPEVREVLDRCAAVQRRSDGYFTATPGGRLDPSAMVKGWAVERASAMLREAGALRHCVNGGGDVRVAGGPEPDRAWRIGVAHPLRPGELATVVTGTDLAVATSGTAERGAHILDPLTGRPAAALASMTVVGPDLTRADAYSTAAFAMGDAARDWLPSLDGFEAYAVTRDGDAWWTRGFPAYGLVDLADRRGADSQGVPRHRPATMQPGSGS